MKDLPDNKEMYLYAQRNLEFFVKTFYLHFTPDIEILQTPAQPETEEQRLNRLISEKDTFFSVRVSDSFQFSGNLSQINNC